MDERVSRRDALRKVLSSGVDTVMRIFRADSETNLSHLHQDASISPEQAGHLLRTRKTTKSHLAFQINSDHTEESLSDKK